MTTNCKARVIEELEKMIAAIEVASVRHRRAGGVVMLTSIIPPSATLASLLLTNQSSLTWSLAKLQ